MGISVRLGSIAVLAAVVAAFGFAGGDDESAAQPAAATGVAGGGQIKIFATLQDFETQTGTRITTFAEAPVLAQRVAAGELPPVEERLPSEPLVVSPKDEIGRYGGTLRVAGTGPGPGGADGFLSRGQPLVILAPDLTTIWPNFIKGWEFSSDNSQFTMFFRRGARWSDGDRFDADDVMFWYQDVMLNDELTPVKPRNWSPGGQLARVEKLDDYTVRFDFRQPYPVVLDQLTVTVEQVNKYPFLPRHFMEQFHAAYNDNAGQLAREAGHESWWQLFTTNWGATPFERDPHYPVINPWAPAGTDQFGNRIFERNAFYWKIDTAGNQLPYADRQVRQIVEDREVWNLKVIAGEIDYAAQHTAIENFPLFKENEGQGGYRAMVWQFDRGSELVNFKLNQNHDDPVLRDLFREVRFRQALSLAIDRDEINEVVFLGGAIPRQAMIVPGVSFYEAWMGNHFAERDVERANQLLDQLDLRWDANRGVRLRPDGQPLEVTFEFVEYAGPRTKMLEIVSENWREIGVDVALKSIQVELYGQRNRAGALQTTIWNLDATTEVGFHQNPFAFLPYALEWTAWLDSGGASGEEPPQEVKDFYALAQRYQQTLLGSDEYRQIGQQLIAAVTDNLWNIGIVGQIPKPVVIKSNLRNTPGEEGTWSWDYRFWTPYQSDQWFFAE